MKSVAGHTNLYRADSGRYYFQRRVPTDLREGLPSLYKSVFWKVALGTSDLAEAKRRLNLKNVEVDLEITRARQQIADAALPAPSVPSPALIETLTLSEADQLADLWVAELLEHDELRRASQPLAWTDGFLYGITATEAKQALAHGHIDAVATSFSKFLERRGKAVEPLGPAYRLLARACLSRVEAAKEILWRRVNGETDKKPQRPHELPRPAAAPLSEPSPLPSAKDTGITIDKLIEGYIADPNSKRSAKTLMGYQIIFRCLRELLGKDKPADSITREDCRKVREALQKLPSNATKRYPGLSIGQTIAKAALLKDPRLLSTQSVNGYLDCLSSLFRWAAREDYMAKNPAEGLRVAEDLTAKELRLPFSLEQLQAMFRAPLYTGCKDDAHGYDKPGPHVIRRGRFWAPLLALFHGLRSNEACQLLTSDISEVQGIPCIHVQLDDEPTGKKPAQAAKRLKTKNAKRIIPLHPELIRMGFLEFVGRQRQAREARLFPEIKADDQGYYSGHISRWFGRFLEKAGAARERTSFHSFRHNFRDALREIHAPLAVAQALGGWTGQQATEDNYGSGLQPASVLPWVEKIAYPGLDLGHLYVTPTAGFRASPRQYLKRRPA
jgi:integrase